MNKANTHWKTSAGLAVAVLIWLGTAPIAQATFSDDDGDVVVAPLAGPPPLNGSLTLRPLTPTEIKTYGLTNPPAQSSAGIGTIAVGGPAYLEAMVNTAITNSHITNITWTLTKPSGSAALLLASPLGTNVPVYKSADATIYKTADRRMLRVDVVGTYTVGLSIQTSDSGSTNLAINLTVATYLGLQTCAACHSGAFVGVPNIYSTYTNTPHASFFTRAIDGLESDQYNKNCISCHVLGYDTNSFSINSGFDDIAKLVGWTFPSVLTNGNWAAMPAQLQNVANVLCENCHGPGSQHIFSGGITGNTNAISISYGAADCSQCHDSLNTYQKSAEWNISLHANTTRSPSGVTRPHCVRCHTSTGFVSWANAGGMTALNQYPTNIIWADSASTNILTYTGTAPTYTAPPNPPNTTYEALTCQTCHDPHDATNPHQVRLGNNVVLTDGTVVTNAGSGGFCMQCHNVRNGSVTNQLAKYPLNQYTWAGGVAFGVHDTPQGDMLEGVNAVTYGKIIPSSPHANVVSNTCVGCHMQAVASTDPAFLKAGGHTFKISYLVTNNSVVTEVPMTAACTKCHGNIQDFNFPVADYNGDGIIEGVQTEVQHLLDKLSTLYPPSVYQSNPSNYVADGIVKSSVSFYTNMPAKFLKAGYNFQFVNADGSLGVHNAAYAVGLLRASIADLTGDSNNDTLPDSWQITYFGAGFATNALAGPNAVNNPAGVPNWMMCTLNLDPRGAFTVAGSGTIFINGNNIVNGATNTIVIYNAAEIVFDTQVGVSYQIQGVSELTGAWSNISTNIPGSGGSISYLTPTRKNLQMFFRVVHTP